MTDEHEAEAGKDADGPERGSGSTRRELLGAAAAAAPAAAALSLPGGTALAKAGRGGRKRSDFRGKNVLIFLTDQERAIQHFPARWRKQNLPGMRKLLRHGVDFTRAYTNACMCTPARATLMTGYFTSQHGCKYTLEEDMPETSYPQVEMPVDFANIASVMRAAGYNVVYKGKWHLNKPAGSEFTPADVAKYGFDRWNPPDAGANQDIDQAGGGSVNNDGRYINESGDWQTGNEGTLQYLNEAAGSEQPFCLIVSLVNPHDVLFYPNTYDQAGYDRSWFYGEIGLPETIDEDLSTKPHVQQQFVRLFSLGSGVINTHRSARNYLNYYANLMRSSDAYMLKVLRTLEKLGLSDDTVVIRTADHGEMGLAHGGLRQKNFNMYEEATRVPLVISNPQIYKRAESCNHLVSHVDFLPTLASLFGSPQAEDWQGVDYSASILDPSGAKAPQDYLLFTFDDYQSGQKNGPYPSPPNHVVGIRERRWKIVRYWDIEGGQGEQWEFYDLRKDPLEQHNLAFKPQRMTANQRKQFSRMKKKLAKAQDQRLAPLPNTPQPVTPPSNKGTIPPNFSV
jgi:arylsulfatase A-like enzyme